MEKYIVIACVNCETYMTKVFAESTGGAEHKVLDLGICGKHGYGVQGCTAYDSALMKTDIFRHEVLEAEPIEFDRLKNIIEKRNEAIRQRDAAEDRLCDIEKELRELTERIELLKAEQRETLEMLNR